MSDNHIQFRSNALTEKGLTSKDAKVLLENFSALFSTMQPTNETKTVLEVIPGLKEAIGKL